MNRSGRSALAGVVLAAGLAGCGSTTPQASMTVDAGMFPVIENPPLACVTTGSSCACTPSDAGVTDPSVGLCSAAVAPDAACCEGPDYPFAGGCSCGAFACSDGGIRVPSCSSPPTEVEAGVCDPATCSGSSCAGGYCCTSACQAGVCQSTCS